MPKVARRRTITEYRFRIAAFTPETMPMARLAEYMHELAQMLGEPGSVHFNRLEPGSTVLAYRIEREAVPKVDERTIAIERGDAPRDATRAYHSINRLLQEDNGKAWLTRGRSKAAVVLKFPGAEEAEDRIPSVRQHGSVDGVIMRVGGIEPTIPILLKSEDQQISGCHADRAMAKKLAGHLFEPVRLFGRGRWSRERTGEWRLIEFKVESFEVLSEDSLTDALKQVRTVVGDFEPGAYEELRIVRHGPEGKKRRGRD